MNVWRIALLGVMVFWLSSLDESKYYDSQINVVHYTKEICKAYQLTLDSFDTPIFSDLVCYGDVQLVTYRLDPRDKLTRNPRDGVKNVWAG